MADDSVGVISSSAFCLTAEVLKTQRYVPVDQLSKNISADHLNTCQASLDLKSEMEKLARLIHPETLGEEDLFYLLAHPDEMQAIAQSPEEAIPFIRKGLDLPLQDPEGVTLSFHTLNPQEGEQIAYIKITPQAFVSSLKFSTSLPAKPPLITFSYSSTYLATLAKLAEVDHRTIIMIHLSETGASRVASQTSASTAEDLFTSLKEVMKKEIPGGVRVDVLGHSLGSLPVRMLFAKWEDFQKETGVRLGKVLLVAPMPSRWDRAMGYAMDATQLNPSPHKSYIPDRVGWIQTFGASYELPTFQNLGKDSHLRVVFAGGDTFFRLENPAQWAKIPGVSFLRDAPHNFIAEQTANAEYVRVLQQALNDPVETEFSDFDLTHLYQHWHLLPPTLHFFLNPKLTLSSDFNLPLGLEMTFAGRRGLTAFNFGGMDLQLGGRGGVGIDVKKGNPLAFFTPEAEVGFSSFENGWRAKAGLALMLYPSDHEENIMANSYAYAGAEWNFEDTLGGAVELRRSFWANVPEDDSFSIFVSVILTSSKAIKLF